MIQASNKVYQNAGEKYQYVLWKMLFKLRDWSTVQMAVPF